MKRTIKEGLLDRLYKAIVSKLDADFDKKILALMHSKEHEPAVKKLASRLADIERRYAQLDKK